MLLLSRFCLVITCWGALALALDFMPGVPPLPADALTISAMVTVGLIGLVFRGLRPHGPIVLWRHRPWWWPLSVALMLLSAAVAVATKILAGAMGEQRGLAVVVIVFTSVAATLAAARDAVPD
ncbi:hypothetical protein [Catellatospora tritici]|uniref:hypothetical protein n=1 Tax=Catellatospora tritici TaxID=2851566 RepID=UPI001C2DB1EE|nr:hypothetical protein [Catellatospora tritici]MBV1848714.1 hypothetical protein [Catellatospora tritici]